MSDEMTELQISNWRRLIFGMLEEQKPGTGRLAFTASREEIVELRDMLQNKINESVPKEETKLLQVNSGNL